jgi:protocatechuate 3,4-dioxygenase beta subunit
MSKKILFWWWCISGAAFAQNHHHASGLFNPQKQTPAALLGDNLSKPKNFNKSNNLTRPVGSFHVAIGEPLYLQGIVTDAFRVPLEGVLIKIWQTNAAGKYHSLLKPNSKYVDKNFLMSGQSLTNNLGYYEFITILPGFYDDRAPHLNIIISHKKSDILLETELYFEEHPLNTKDPIYNMYPPEDKKRLTAKIEYVDNHDPTQGKVAIFNITLDTIQQYKRF